MKKLHAFTLIELLVVISIIAILAGLALPVFTNALEKGRATEDNNNLASIGKGIVMYLNDSDDTMFDSSGADDTAWPNVLQSKYVKDWKVFRSPFDKANATRPKTDTPPVPISYGLSEKTLEAAARFVGKWKNTGSAVILAAPAVDTSATGKTVKFMASAISGKTVKITRPSGVNLGTHQTRRVINVLFADAHVEQMEWTKYIGNTTEIEKQRWDPMYETK